MSERKSDGDIEKTIARRKFKEKLTKYYETYNKEAIENIDAHIGLQRSLKDYLKKLDETYDTRSVLLHCF